MDTDMIFLAIQMGFIASCFIIAIIVDKVDRRKKEKLKKAQKQENNMTEHESRQIESQTKEKELEAIRNRLINERRSSHHREFPGGFAVSDDGGDGGK